MRNSFTWTVYRLFQISSCKGRCKIDFIYCKSWHLFWITFEVQHLTSSPQFNISQTVNQTCLKIAFGEHSDCPSMKKFQTSTFIPKWNNLIIWYSFSFMWLSPNANKLLCPFGLHSNIIITLSFHLFFPLYSLAKFSYWLILKIQFSKVFFPHFQIYFYGHMALGDCSERKNIECISLFI